MKAGWLATLLFLLTVGFSTADVLNLQSPPYSAVADGTTDTTPALQKAIAAAKTGDTILIPAGHYRVELQKGKRLTLPAGVTLQGVAGRTHLSLAIKTGEESGHREFLGFQSGTTLDGLTITRAESFPLVMLPIFGGDIDGVTVSNCTLDGNKSDFPEKYCHIFQVGIGKVKHLTLQRSTIRDASFGLFQSNQSTGSLTDVLVEQCLFEENTASDLEFNSPRGTMKRIQVRDCTFRHNHCPNPSAGFAVGFANVQDSSVKNCRIENYLSEALHIEDRSEHITLSGNTIVSSSLKQSNGVILVINDSRNVLIEDNIIDGRKNENRVNLILVTAGGSKFKNPSDIAVRNNILLNSDTTRTWYLQPGSSQEPTGNEIIGSGREE